MKIHVRYMLESIIVSILLFVLPIALQIVQGALITMKHVPDVSEYANVSHLQSQVSFGIDTVHEPNWTSVGIRVGLFVLIVIAYYSIRIWFSRRTGKSI